MQNLKVRKGFIAAILGKPPETIRRTTLILTALRKESEEDKLGILSIFLRIRNVVEKLSLDEQKRLEYELRQKAAREKSCQRNKSRYSTNGGNPMGYIYFARHGQTIWNVENKICGVIDIELTEKGHRQAEELAEKILEEGTHIDEIICSPLVRAAETARHISEVTGVPMRVEQRLTEQNFGKYEGTPRDGEEFERAKICFADSYGGGESMIRFCHRIYGLLDDIRDEADEKVYLLVAHNGVARAVQSYFTDMTNEEFAKFGIGNCELIKFEF